MADRVFELVAGAYRSGELGVVSFHGAEQLSRPFSFDILVSASPIDVEAELVGETAALTLHGDDPPRAIHGMIARIRSEGPETARDRALYKVRLVPRIWSLGLSKSSRVFQDLSVREIVSAILDERRLVHRWKVSRSYPPRAYCVQYEESDLAFVSRILAEEGIAYAVEAVPLASPDGPINDVVVFFDGPSHHEPIAGRASLSFHEPDGRARGNEHVEAFTWQKRVLTGSTLLSGFDFRRPQTGLTASVEAPAQAASGSSPERAYDHDLEWSVWSTSAESARVRLEQRRARARVGAGRSSSRRLAPGRTFSLEEHPHGELNARYTVVRIEHEGRQPEVAGAAFAAAGGERLEIYKNRFWCVPDGTSCRPRLPKRAPRQIMETATVVGPAGEEIHTDEHGRVKVQFHWDREGKRDDRSSCWIRVSTPWAGSAWGAQFIPRVGMEVAVSFIGGDTDRPMILGALYNGMNVPPFHLPAKKTQSGFRTRSTPGGAGSNELRFDDAATEEQIYVHAQKNMDEVIENDATRMVRGNETLTVQKDRTLEVTGDFVRTVRGSEVVSIEKNFVLHVVGKQILHVECKMDGGAAAHAPYPEEKDQPAPPPPARTEEELRATLEEARRRKVAAAKLLWMAEGLPPDVYERGRATQEGAERAAEAIDGLDQETRGLEDEAAIFAAAPSAPGAPESAAILERRVRDLAPRFTEAMRTVSDQMTDALEPAPPAFHRFQNAAIEHLRGLAKQVESAQGALFGVTATLADPEGASGRGSGGGGGWKQEDDKGITFNTLDSDKKPTTKTTPGGSQINVTGGGAIVSPDGFKIEAGGCSIEMCGGVLTLKGSTIRLN